MSKTVDVIIIGAGVIGAATAFELAKKGYQTLNFDKLPAAGQGSTGSSSAGIRTHYSTWDGVAMAYEGYFHWKNWTDYLAVVDERGMARFKNTGGLVLGNESEKLLKLLTRVGVDFELWDLDLVKKKIPIYSDLDYSPPKRPEDETFFERPSRKFSRAIYTPSSGYMNDPQLVTHNLQAAAESKGSRFMFKRRVVEIRRSSAKIVGVKLNDGERIDAPVVVNAAGPHSFMVNRMAGLQNSMKIKTRALRHEVHVVPSPKGFDFEKKGYVTSDFTNATYHLPEVGNCILVGSQDPACDPKVWIEDPDHFNRQVTTAQWRAQVYRLAQRIPSLGIPDKPKGLADLYDVSDDWIPIYDRSDLEGFYLAIGTSGNQFKNAPVVGRLMAELIDACENGHDHDRQAVKFAGQYTGHILNAGFYSRMREIHRDSSFSVVG
jgi:sarcosine oxidase subunit beta